MTNPSGRALDLAEHALIRGNAARAKELLESVSAQGFDDPHWWTLRVRAAVDAKTKVDVAKQGIGRFPNHHAILVHGAEAAGEAGDLALGEQWVLAALREDPEDVTALCVYSRLTARAGQQAKATALLDRAAALDPEHPLVLSDRALLACLAGNDGEAEAANRAMLRADPNDAVAHYNAAAIAAGEGKADAARGHLATAVRADPGRFLAPGAIPLELKVALHPLMWPIRPIAAVGPLKLWVGFILTQGALRSAGYSDFAAVFSAVYFVLVIYSWTMPPFLKAYLKRKDGGA